MMKKDLFASVLIGLSLMLVTGSGMISAAEGDASSAETDAYDEQCADIVIAKGQEMLTQYETFLDEYFNKNVPSSNQVNQAMKYYRYVQDTMHETYADAMGVNSGETFDDFNAQNSVCVEERDKVINTAGIIFQAYVNNSVSTKQTAAMVDALNDLNNNMEGLSSDFHSTFPNLFTSMSNALPCYAQKCISK